MDIQIMFIIFHENKVYAELNYMPISQPGQITKKDLRVKV